MLAKNIFADKSIKNPRIIVVTDRKDLDRQIRDTFKNCKLKQNVVQAKSAADLMRKLKEKESGVITTLVHKFDAAFKRGDSFVDNDPNIFVFIDEAHRTQTGKANANMNKILPNACIIAFTGTPLMKGEHASFY